MLKFWDLPGVGSNEFPKATYLSRIEVDRYDFFLLITADRFTENDTWLGNEFRKRNKKYFFVRTKIGVDISNNKKAHPRTHDEKAVINEIRESTARHLQASGFGDVPMFLIDNYELQKFQFEELEQQLVNDFPDLKRSALILSLRSTSEKMVQIKVKELRRRIWITAALSGFIAAVPIPGLSVAIDIALTAEETHFYFTQLGLNTESLQRYAKSSSVDYDTLEGIVDSALGIKAVGVNVIKWLPAILARLLPSAAATAVEETAKAFLPIIGSLIAVPLSFGATYLTLKVILDKLEKVAIEVNKFTAESICTACT